MIEDAVLRRSTDVWREYHQRVRPCSLDRLCLIDGNLGRLCGDRDYRWDLPFLAGLDDDIGHLRPLGLVEFVELARVPEECERVTAAVDERLRQRRQSVVIDRPGIREGCVNYRTNSFDFRLCH